VGRDEAVLRGQWRALFVVEDEVVEMLRELVHGQPGLSRLPPASVAG